MKQYRHLEELYSEFRMKRVLIRKRIREYKRIQPDQYFYELLYCLMTPQSSAINAAKAQAKFEAADFFHNVIDPLTILFQKEHYIRFHKSKSVWIREMKDNFDAICNVIVSDLLAEEKRDWLGTNVKGLGYKEATHFLRNIGLNDGLTILDRHILRNLKYHNVIRTIPATLTKKKYLSIEKQFLKFAQEINISTDELDLLFWSRETGEVLK